MVEPVVDEELSQSPNLPAQYDIVCSFRQCGVRNGLGLYLTRSKTGFIANFFQSAPSKQNRSTFKVEVNNSGNDLVSSRELSTIAESDSPTSDNEGIRQMKEGSPSE
jgi:hypothetical protein